MIPGLASVPLSGPPEMNDFLPSFVHFFPSIFLYTPGSGWSAVGDPGFEYVIHVERRVENAIALDQPVFDVGFHLHQLDRLQGPDEHCRWSAARLSDACAQSGMEGLHRRRNSPCWDPYGKAVYSAAVCR